MKINKEFLLKIWRDPVLSKVISVGVLGVIGTIYALLESAMNNSSFTESVIDVLTIQIKLWHILVGIIVFVIFYSIRTLCRIKTTTNREGVLQYNFLDECETNLKGYIWRWTWSKIENTSKYKITDLHPLCPNCKGELTIPVVFSNYECGKCNYEVETQYVPSTSVVKKQIVSDLRNKYPNEALLLES